MNVLHLLTTGRSGGIEVLVKEFSMLSKQNNYYAFFWDGGWITDAMKKNGNNVIELHASKKDFRTPLVELDKLIKQERIDVIIAHHAAPMLWICMNILKKKNKNIKTIAYAHANLKDMYRENEKKGLWLRKTTFKWTYKSVDAVVAISQSVYNSFKEYSYKNLEKIKIIYNGVDVNKFKRDVFEIHNPIRIVYAGRLVEEKGVQTILKALSELDTNDEFIFDIAGEGPEKEHLKTLCKEYGIEDKVIFQGVREDMPEFLKQEDIFVHAPVWEEGFGIALAEAMASGLLCIGLKKGAIPEIIDNGVNGFIIEPTESLAKKISYAIQFVKSTEGTNMRCKAIEKSEKFSITSYVNALDNLCETV